ncbi:lytic transglycosylase domain-containing protein [Streptomyces sp. RB6PN25]|uniref:Lytic transglycosylase domain-containing protein n=1 Tax=Streptomyces humicola TaxID=2953240 RepID=A0ABT1Q200_9ACTN|nr:lytic transglycosylase domain-containing protein [Streptomyces humicola]MCQ4083944.1 lytic transglycosylase domain-containing protein [Streptomyces humicola]
MSLALGVVLLVAAGLGVFWWLTRPPALPRIPIAYLPTVQQAAKSCPELSVPLLAAQIEAESKWNPQADSGKAQGIAQFDPTTWAEWGKDYAGDGKADVWDPKDAIPTQGAYMCHLFQVVKNVPGNPTQLALAAYNAGPNAVLQAQGIPQINETQNYVNKIEQLIPQYTTTYAQQIGATTSPSPSSG